MNDLQVIDLKDEIRNRGEGRRNRNPGAINTPGRDPGLRLEDSERTRCEVWTRIMGYHRPVSVFNAGKRAEHGERQYFTECPVTTEEPIERVA